LLNEIHKLLQAIRLNILTMSEMSFY